MELPSQPQRLLPHHGSAQQTLSSDSRDISTPPTPPLTPRLCLGVLLLSRDQPSLELQVPGIGPAPLLLPLSHHLGSALGWASSPCPTACPAAQPSEQSQSSTGSAAGVRRPINLGSSFALL